MHTKTRASALEIYLFFLLISLFAVSGCGLDVDFGGGSGTDDVAKNEVIMGVVEDIIPDISEGSGLVVKAYVIKDETVFCCEDTTSLRDEFYIEGDLNPKAEIRIFQSGDQDSPLGTIRIPVFPGSVIDIQNIITKDRVVTDDHYINVGFEGQVDSKDCLDDTSPRGTIRVKISSEGSETEVAVNLTSGTDIQRADEDDLPCEEIVEGRKVEVDGKLRIGETVDAELIRIL